MDRVPQQEQVIVVLDVRQAASEVRPDAALGVFFGERPELSRDEHSVTGVEVLVNLMRNVLAESVEDGVPRDVVRVTHIVHCQLPVDLLDSRHWSNTS
jgi:hypothetical protein